MTHADELDKLRSLLSGERFAMLTTTAESGALHSRPMTIQEIDDDWVVRFIAQAEDAAARDSDGRPVNLAIVDGNTYVSLSGHGRVESDVAKKRELWDRITEAYAGEPEDLSNVVLEVHVDSAEYWEGGNRLGQLVGLAKAAITGDRPDGGDHASFDI